MALAWQFRAEVDIEETETDAEPRFSSLLVPGGIDLRYDDGDSQRGRPDYGED